MRFFIHEICVCICIWLPYAFSKVEQIDVPVKLARCYNGFYNKTTVARSVGYSIHFSCYQEYRLKTSTDRKYKGKLLGLKNNAYLKGNMDGVESNLRAKRQAEGQGKPPRRQRKEIRMMTDEEREKYFNAITTLKSTNEQVDNESISRFGLLAAFHSGEQLGAHGGCGFGPWHRAFLIMYEQAMMQVDPTVTLPYWDSTLDFYMEDATQSILWTDKFMGNGDGLVTTGPFKNWETAVGPLTRNIGVSGKLYSEEDFLNVTSRTRYGEICGDEALPEHDMEFLHGPPHVWIDGQMGIIETAAHDPIFFMHHSFVDLIWEKFRDNQRRNGIDPQVDYPAEFFGDIFHAPEEAMGIGSMTMKDGLDDKFTRDIYEYAPRPTCSRNNQDCGSKYIKCVDVAGAFRCVSKTLEEYEDDMATGGGNTGGGNTGGGNTGGGNTGGGNTGGGNTGGGNTGGGNTGGGSCPTPKPHVPKPPKVKPTLHKPVQNNFCVNGKSDTREWVYLPIRVTYQRPPDFTNYGSYPIRNGKQASKSDIYAPSGYSAMNKYIRPGRPENYGNCKSSTSGAGEMYIQSDGLNYDGTYREYAVIDHRLAISMSVAYVAVKKPEIHDPSDVVISAFDSCGRVCHATCLIPGTDYYRPCSGALRISDVPRFPKMYGGNFGNSVMNVWNYTSSASCPQFNIDQIYVSFFCDYSNRWPWEHARKQNLPPPPPKRRPSVDNQPKGPRVANKQTDASLSLPQTPQKQKCAIRGCMIERDDCRAPCENLVNYPCVNKCNTFARCFYKKYYIQTCSYGHYDITEGKCQRGKGHCTDEEYNSGSRGGPRHQLNHNRARHIHRPVQRWGRPGFG
ncbi:Hypothetical predicted protein [Mytilus galloprovincialis]|uniref:Tyrosinase copper-binding domain-containing protein n=1 Tax=Mytilus galloprovincialis TaxID=29158 RepID=A0A8B6GYS2_MYTGA|nr:Hypothetical predicted protein [Mytilus galloprovincialis]